MSKCQSPTTCEWSSPKVIEGVLLPPEPLGMTEVAAQHLDAVQDALGRRLEEVVGACQEFLKQCAELQVEFGLTGSGAAGAPATSPREPGALKAAALRALPEMARASAAFSRSFHKFAEGLWEELGVALPPVDFDQSSHRGGQAQGGEAEPGGRDGPQRPAGRGGEAPPGQAAAPRLREEAAEGKEPAACREGTSCQCGCDLAPGGRGLLREPGDKGDGAESGRPPASPQSRGGGERREEELRPGRRDPPSPEHPRVAAEPGVGGARSQLAEGLALKGAAAVRLERAAAPVAASEDSIRAEQMVSEMYPLAEDEYRPPWQLHSKWPGSEEPFDDEEIRRLKEENREYEQRCHGSLRDEHAVLEPHMRWERSWGMTLAYAKVAMIANDEGSRRGTVEKPFVIWVMCQTVDVEVDLARQGYFDTANSIDGAPTIIILAGESLPYFERNSPPVEGRPPAICTADGRQTTIWWEGMAYPDLVALFMPGPGATVTCPTRATNAIQSTSAVISMRSQPPERISALLNGFFFRQVRNPFSAYPESAEGGGDNSWLFMVDAEFLVCLCEMLASDNVAPALADSTASPSREAQRAGEAEQGSPERASAALSHATGGRDDDDSQQRADGGDDEAQPRRPRLSLASQQSRDSGLDHGDDEVQPRRPRLSLASQQSRDSDGGDEVRPRRPRLSLVSQRSQDGDECEWEDEEEEEDEKEEEEEDEEEDRSPAGGRDAQSPEHSPRPEQRSDLGSPGGHEVRSPSPSPRPLQQSNQGSPPGPSEEGLDAAAQDDGGGIFSQLCNLIPLPSIVSAASTALQDSAAAVEAPAEERPAAAEDLEPRPRPEEPQPEAPEGERPALAANDCSPPSQPEPPLEEAAAAVAERSPVASADGVKPQWQLESYWPQPRPGEDGDGLPGTVEHWRELESSCSGALREAHAAKEPRERRASSWGMMLAYAKCALSTRSGPMRTGTVERPFVIWVLCATTTAEVWLAQRGYFDAASCVDNSPTLIVLINDGLPAFEQSWPPAAGQPPAICTAACDPEIGWQGLVRPDLVAVFMPGPETVAPLPQSAVDAVRGVPAVVSTRYRLCEVDQRGLAGLALFPQVRNPFSACPESNLAHDDNRWIFAVPGEHLARACDLQVPVLKPVNKNIAKVDRTPVSAWGILDIKFDTSLPVLDRLKVLEAGDGRKSSFSGEGREIRERFEGMFRLAEPGCTMHELVSSDKKLLHDLVDDAGYEHLLPQQACFAREYHRFLASQVLGALKISGNEHVVLKLCNKTRAAGVWVVRAGKLDSTLQDLLTPPKDVEAFLKEETELLAETNHTGLHPGEYKECRRHWWSNECPVFIAERVCSSLPTPRDGKMYDATLRVAFVMHPRKGSPSLHAEWLGCYWKLPKAPLSQKGSGKIMDCVVSAARTSGTAQVQPWHASEAFAALGDLLPQLLGRGELSVKILHDRYAERPALLAYLTAKIGVAKQYREDLFRACLSSASVTAVNLPDGQPRNCITSYVSRWRHILNANRGGKFKPDLYEHEDGEEIPRTQGKKPVQDNDDRLRKALNSFPLNANAHYQQGVSHTQKEGGLDDAVVSFRKSLVLDPDFKHSYVYLGMCHLQRGEWKRALCISEAGNARHPGPQLQYHIGVALANLANEDKTMTSAVREQKFQQALEQLRKARSSPDAAGRCKKDKNHCKSPWLAYDDQLIAWLSSRLEFPWDGEERPEMPKCPEHVGWKGMPYRF